MTSVTLEAPAGRADLTVTAEQALCRGQQLFLELCGWRRPRETVQAMIVRGAKAAGLEYERARELYYGRVRHFLAHELMQMGARVSHQRERQARQLATLEDMAARGLPLPVGAMLPPAAWAEAWHTELRRGTKAVIVVCLLATTLCAILDSLPDAARVKRGGGNGGSRVTSVSGGKAPAGKGGFGPRPLGGGHARGGRGLA